MVDLQLPSFFLTWLMGNLFRVTFCILCVWSPTRVLEFWLLSLSCDLSYSVPSTGFASLVGACWRVRNQPSVRSFPPVLGVPFLCRSIFAGRFCLFWKPLAFFASDPYSCWFAGLALASRRFCLRFSFRFFCNRNGWCCLYSCPNFITSSLGHQSPGATRQASKHPLLLTTSHLTYFLSLQNEPPSSPVGRLKKLPSCTCWRKNRTIHSCEQWLKTVSSSSCWAKNY